MRNAKADRNQPEIVAALRKAGCSVQHLHTMGHGCPDIAVGWQGRTYLLEIKDGTLPPSAQKLTPQEAEWHRDWRGHAAIVNCVRDAFFVIGLGFKE